MFVESASNPDGIIADLEAIAAIAHAHGVPLIVDNTLPTPYLCQPLKWGADIVVHSMTKYLGGQGNSVGGAIVEGGKFDWANGKFPLMTEPTEAYHGLRFFETFGNFALTVRNKAIGLRDMGPALSPFNAFLILQGVETLPLRMDRHVANADQVAAWLATNPHVSLGLLPPPAAEPHAAAGEILPARPGLGVHDRRQGRLRDGRAAGRQLPAAQPRRQYRRHPLADHPPGLDHPPPARRASSWWRPAPARTWSGCRSGSRAPPTSSPIWSRRWPLPPDATAGAAHASPAKEPPACPPTARRRSR